MASLTLALGLLAQGSFAQEGPGKAEILRLLGGISALPEIRASVAQSGYEGENLDLAVAQMARMLGDDAIASHIAERILAAGRGDWQTAKAAQGLVQPLLARGMGHLAPRELQYFLEVERVVMGALSLRSCGLIFKNRLGPEAIAKRTAEAAARLNTPALREYYRIQYKAARLGATRPPKRREPALRAQTRAEIGAALSAAAAADPAAQAALADFERIDRVSAVRACVAGRFFLDVVMTMEPRARHAALLTLSVGE